MDNNSFTMQASTTFDWPVRVYYEDTDSGGVVYHANYLNFMERARTEWLRSLGFEQTTLKEDLNVLFVVHSMALQFKSPAKFNDPLIVQSQLLEMGHGSIGFRQTVLRAQQTLLVATVKLACVDSVRFKPVVIPAVIKAALLPLVKNGAL